MYYIKLNCDGNIHIRDLGVLLTPKKQGILVSDIEYVKSRDIQLVKNKLIITRIYDRVGYNEKQEIFNLTKIDNVIYLQDGKYNPNTQTITVFVNGELIDKSLYIEASDSTVEFLAPFNQNDNAVLVQYIDKDAIAFLPENSYIRNLFIQEVSLTAGDINIILIKNLVNINQTILSLYVDGILIPNSAYVLLNDHELNFVAPIEADCLVTIICFEYQEPILGEFDVQRTSILSNLRNPVLNPIFQQITKPTGLTVSASSVSSVKKSKIYRLANVFKLALKRVKEVLVYAKSKILGWFSMGRSGR